MDSPSGYSGNFFGYKIIGMVGVANIMTEPRSLPKAQNKVISRLKKHVWATEAIKKVASPEIPGLMVTYTEKVVDMCFDEVEALLQREYNRIENRRKGASKPVLKRNVMGLIAQQKLIEMLMGKR